MSLPSGRLQLSVGRAFGFLPPRNHVISFEELSGLSLRFEPDAPLPLELHIERAGVAFPPIRFAVDNLDRANRGFSAHGAAAMRSEAAQQAPTDYRRIAPTAPGRPWMGYGVRLVNETDTVIRLVDEPSDEVEVVKPFEPMAEADYEELTASEAPEDEAHAPLVDFDRWSPLAEMPFRLIGLLLVWSALFVAPPMALFVCFFSPYLIAGSSTPLRFIVMCFLVGPPVMLVLGSMPGLLPDRLSDEPRYLARLFRWKAFVVSWTAPGRSSTPESGTRCRLT